jgi:succinate dehydrogenase / fumarate reductase, membrane anchor subunit
MVTKVVVGAHYGLKDWLAQRITAIVMAVYTLIFIAVLLSGGPIAYESWKTLFGKGLMGLMPFLTLLFVVSVLIHAWIGVRDILMDYIKPAALRLAFEVVTILWLVGCAGWALRILWRL